MLESIRELRDRVGIQCGLKPWRKSTHGVNLDLKLVEHDFEVVRIERLHTSVV